MKRFSNKAAFAAALLSLAALTGCAKKENAPAGEEQQEALDLTGYVVKDALKYVKLGDFDGMEVESPVYSIRDEDVEMEISNRLYEASEEEHPDREIREDDVIVADLETTVDGASDLAEDVPIDLGFGEYGPELDAQMPGHKAGDVVTFSDTFDEEAEVEEWRGKTVDFTVTVKYIEEFSVPELTDDFVKKTYGADSVDAYRTQVREELEELTEVNNRMQDSQVVILEAMERSTFEGCPDELLESCRSEVREQYEPLAEAYEMTLEEFYDFYEIKDEDLEAEAQDSANRKLFLSAIFEDADLSLTQTDLTEYTERYKTIYGFDTAEEMEESMGRDWLIQAAMEEKAGTYLSEKATISHVEPDYEMEDLAMEEGETEDWGEVEELGALPFSNEFFYGEDVEDGAEDDFFEAKPDQADENGEPEQADEGEELAGLAE